MTKKDAMAILRKNGCSKTPMAVDILIQISEQPGIELDTIVMRMQRNDPDTRVSYHRERARKNIERLYQRGLIKYERQPQTGTYALSDRIRD